MNILVLLKRLLIGVVSHRCFRVLAKNGQIRVPSDLARIQRSHHVGHGQRTILLVSRGATLPEASLV